MLVVKSLIWDQWNKKHISNHDVSIEDVNEVCQGKFKAKKSYRNRVIIEGKTKKNRKLIIILSPEDRNLKVYGGGIYYPLTAFEEVD